MGSADDWGIWRQVNATLRLTPRSLHEVLDGGQAFRWNSDAQGHYTGVFATHVVQLRPDAAGLVEWRGPDSAAESALRTYLGLDIDFPHLVDCLPWRSDAVLATAMQSFPGLRILCQPLGETLFCFLCSATKQIVQIKEIAEIVAARFGDPLPNGFRALPSWETLAAIPEAELRACKLGFRARYIHETAQFLAAHPGYLDAIARQPLVEARQHLLRLPGVGAKIADCVLLFGNSRLDAFPVDVWVQRAMTQLYGLEGWSGPQIAHFAHLHFGAAAGLAQQYLFAWIRENRLVAGKGRTGNPV